jgi:hypothetical protein
MKERSKFKGSRVQKNLKDLNLNIERFASE